jgi:ribosome-binding protein aMBF1 (putative translation factor)
MVRPRQEQPMQTDVTSMLRSLSDMGPQTKLDTTYHDRRLARRLKEDPEFRAEFQRQRREIAQIDSIVRQLDELRERAGMSKAELARAIGKEPSSIRRLFTADVNPELKTVAAIADALGAEVRVVDGKRARKKRSRRVGVAVA